MRAVNPPAVREGGPLETSSGEELCRRIFESNEAFQNDHPRNAPAKAEL
jgi:hypothetical protein